MKVHFQDQLTQKDQVINGLTNTVNEIKAQLQVRIRISYLKQLLSQQLCLSLDLEYA